MADYIDREELLKYYGLNEATKYGNETAEQQANSYSTLMLYEIADLINDMPSIDAVEVVRCKDCKHYRNNNLCGVSGLIVDDDFFCKWGEKE